MELKIKIINLKKINVKLRKALFFLGRYEKEMKKDFIKFK
jgi:hypothetical protein